ncbi:MAG: hydroxymethylglutaryl-CoA reductase, degradative [Bacteroidales bacterium]|nr:hydroxymethylglutaryl-CoA reductase, degradative [Bacteroidales bacterium]
MKSHTNNYIAKSHTRQSKIINGFSKLTKEEKLNKISEFLQNSNESVREFKSFWHADKKIQKRIDEFSENTISNYYFPYGIAPNVVINGKSYLVPMTIEESSVVAAASKSAKYWAARGGFHAKVISVSKIGQVHFIYNGNVEKLYEEFPRIKSALIERAKPITANMEERGGGIQDIELVDKTDDMEGYFQLKATFNTVDSMGANFINSCLEEFAAGLQKYFDEHAVFEPHEKDIQIIMSILSNYTPECLVECWVECDIEELASEDLGMGAEPFAEKFEKAVKIAHIDTYRATTHNKGIFNGIDAVALATGNDFRAIEAAGHTYAARTGKYQSLSEVTIKDGKFRYSLKLPLALGTVGGLTTLHPLVKKSLELLDHPKAEELMMITATMGLANNFGAIKSLVTSGIQKGHMKMHLLNILNTFDATDQEKKQAIEYFKNIKVSYANVSDFLTALRKKQ